MLDSNVMTSLLIKYDGFLTSIAVSVLRQIEDGNPKIERKIIDFLKGKMFPVSLERIIEYLQKIPPENVRERVVEYLRDMHATLMDMVVFVGAEGSRQLIYLPMIRVMENEDHPDRALAMATLCCFDFPEAVNRLARSFVDLSSEMRWVTIVILKKRWDEKFVPIFLKALEDKDPEVVRVAILAMSRATVPAASEPIKKLLYSSSELIVLSAIRSLVELGSSDILDEFRMLFEKTDNHKIRATIASAFGDLDGDGVLDFLKECLYAPDARVRANAVMALKKKHDKLGSLPSHIVERIVELKSDQDTRVQADCVQALWSMGMADNLADIEKLLVSSNEMSRSSGAYLCGKLKLFQLKKQLENLTADPSWTVRKMSAIALLAFGDSGRSVLKQLMEYGTSDQQIVSAFAVGLTDDPSAIEKLIEQSRSGSEMAEMATSLLLRLAKPVT
ncbi:MAG: hypothetical protein CVV41_19365 [Candidatus Riflebacteria bacterium HGW-Riflebacteria-1]|jgi:HEAT repeat protein|nr:MAG: hypothetical protein CVV41_19365 [Candidatus Riflebacteria bacterium HGW-Riflebacteria-1]